jgi:vacuolar-type H+-ATPase catalytic subunit A/Vma1
LQRRVPRRNIKIAIEASVKKSTKKSLTKASREGGKPWRDALRLELARADGPQGTALERIARIVVNNALNGDMEAIYEVANRIDGKVAVQDSHEIGEPIQKLVVTWEAPRERFEAHQTSIKTIEHLPAEEVKNPASAAPTRTKDSASAVPFEPRVPPKAEEGELPFGDAGPFEGNR